MCKSGAVEALSIGGTRLGLVNIRPVVAQLLVPPEETALRPIRGIDHTGPTFFEERGKRPYKLLYTYFDAGSDISISIVRESQRYMLRHSRWH